MRVRFLADADLNLAIVSGVRRREPTLDFLTAGAAALRGLTDAEVWNWRRNGSEFWFRTMSVRCRPTFAFS